MNYILYGEQSPMIKKRLNKILLERLKTPDEFNVARFDYNDCDFSEIIEEASLLPLGYERKAIIIDNCSFLASAGNKEIKEQAANLVKNSCDEIDIVFIHHASSVDEKCELYSLVKENGSILNFVNLEKKEWNRYAEKFFKEKNVEIDTQAINELISRIDGDLNRFINEANKLCLYKDKITLMDVTLMVSKPLEDDVFQISNALLRGENSTAINIYRDLKLQGTKFIDTLIPMLGTQFRFINQVMYLDRQGLSKQDIASELKTSEGRVGITLRNARYLSASKVVHALDDLYYLDYQIKSGQIDRSYGFELFLINF